MRGMAYYGVDGGWCLTSGALVGHVKVMFIRGTDLEQAAAMPFGTAAQQRRLRKSPEEKGERSSW